MLPSDTPWQAAQSRLARSPVGTVLVVNYPPEDHMLREMMPNSYMAVGTRCVVVEPGNVAVIGQPHLVWGIGREAMHGFALYKGSQTEQQHTASNSVINGWVAPNGALVVRKKQHA